MAFEAVGTALQQGRVVAAGDDLIRAADTITLDLNKGLRGQQALNDLDVALGRASSNAGRAAATLGKDTVTKWSLCSVLGCSDGTCKHTSVASNPAAAREREGPRPVTYRVGHRVNSLEQEERLRGHFASGAVGRNLQAVAACGGLTQASSAAPPAPAEPPAPPLLYDVVTIDDNDQEAQLRMRIRQRQLSRQVENYF